MDDVLADYAATVTPALIAGYDALPSAQIYASVLDLFPDRHVRIADIGAGTGRDAAWLARQGHRVLAVEPVAAFREAGAVLHGGAVEWLDDQLPELGQTEWRGPFDLVLLCAVWHHLDTVSRARAVRSLARMTALGGRVILSLRHDPGAPGPGTFPAPPEETIDLACAAGFHLMRRAEADSVHAEGPGKGRPLDVARLYQNPRLSAARRRHAMSSGADATDLLALPSSSDSREGIDDRSAHARPRRETPPPLTPVARLRAVPSHR